MGGRRESTFRMQRWWLVVLIALIALPTGLVTARQLGSGRQSPATGRAQVVTQGVSALPDGDVVWRVVERTARPRAEAPSGQRVLGFILATEEPVLLTNVTPTGEEDVARLAPGESYLVKQGTRQIRASLTDQPTKYISIELVPAADARDTNGGNLLFVSDPFAAPQGERDIDLVRNVLLRGDTATLPDTGENVAILATEGAIDITPASGRGRSLDAGEGAVFASGDLEIAPATPSASMAGGVRALSSLTSSLQTGSGVEAAYVVAVIGPEIPPKPTAVPPTSTPVPPATATSTPAPPQLGSISATVYICPEGMTLKNLVGESCQLAEPGYDLALSGPAGNLGLGDATDYDGAWLWQGLPLGAYQFAETALPAGYETYFVPGSAAVGGSPADGYTVTIDPSAPEIGLTVYNFMPETLPGSLTLDLFLCPEGSVPNDYSPANCPQATGGFEASLVGYGSGVVYGMGDAQQSGGSVVWPNLPPDSYYLTIDALPSPWNTVMFPDGSVYNVGGGQWIPVGGEANPLAYVPVYAFQINAIP